MGWLARLDARNQRVLERHNAKYTNEWWAEHLRKGDEQKRPTLWPMMIPRIGSGLVLVVAVVQRLRRSREDAASGDVTH